MCNWYLPYCLVGLPDLGVEPVAWRPEPEPEPDAG